MIYEARPNVTVDVASLCLKSGNAVLLRGGHAAEHTNAATLAVIAPYLKPTDTNHNMVATVDQYGRDGATAMMEARGHIDVLVPRGGAGLIQAVVRNSKVPVIETGAGNVHIYIDNTGNLDKAIPIIINAKTQRVGVCNATEKLLVHKDVAAEFLPKIAAAALAAAERRTAYRQHAYGIIACRNRKCATRACRRRGLGHRISGTQNGHQGGADLDAAIDAYQHATPQGTPNPSSPKIMRPSRNSPSASTRRW